MKRNYVKKLGILFSLAISLIVVGCSKNAPSSDLPDTTETAEESSNTSSREAVEETSENTTDSENGESEQSSETVSDAVSDENLDEPISYTYQNHPYSFVGGEKELAMANIYSIELDANEKAKYSALQKKLDELGEDYEKEIKDFFTGSENEIRELIDSGWFIPYELDHDYIPIRSDGRVFSFSQLDYTYLAGAHGVANFKTWNLNPATGENISFSSVVKDTKDLPEIIADELQKQNKDLVEYFETCPTDLQNLKDGIPERLSDDAKNLAWALDYDGIVIYFEDYAMGSYAAGSQSVKLSFKDYPDVFTDTYNNYSDGQIPDIKSYAKELKEAEKEVISASEGLVFKDYEEPFGTEIDVDAATLKKMNIFLSNFSEAGLFDFDKDNYQLREIFAWAFIWTKLNKWENISYEQRPDDGIYSVCEVISLKDMNTVLDKYLGFTVSDEEAAAEISKPDEWYGLFYEDGGIKAPAADGESYTGFTVVHQVEDLGDNRLKLYFANYSQDLDAYFDGVDKDTYYGLKGEEADSHSELEKMNPGYAVVRVEGSSYKLEHLEIKY
jgi:hypothetical protein